MKVYLTRREVSQQFPISFSHLAHLACQGRGPRYAIIGRNAIYRREDLENWIAGRMIEPVAPEQSRGRGRPKKKPRGRD
jgi:hypothetical protein